MYYHHGVLSPKSRALSLEHALASPTSPSYSNTDSTISHTPRMGTVQEEPLTLIRVDGMSDALSCLDCFPEDRISIFRHLVPHGVSAESLIPGLCSQFGEVACVILLRARGNGPANCRPYSIGFGVMRSIEAARSIVEHADLIGKQYRLVVQPFRRNARPNRMGDASPMSEVHIPTSPQAESPTVRSLPLHQPPKRGSVFPFDDEGVRRDVGHLVEKVLQPRASRIEE